MLLNIWETFSPSDKKHNLLFLFWKVVPESTGFSVYFSICSSPFLSPLLSFSPHILNNCNCCIHFKCNYFLHFSAHSNNCLLHEEGTFYLQNSGTWCSAGGVLGLKNKSRRCGTLLSLKSRWLMESTMHWKWSKYDEQQICLWSRQNYVFLTYGRLESTVASNTKFPIVPWVQ